MARALHAPRRNDDLPLFAMTRPGVVQLRQPSRNSDPETSHEAAHQLIKSGKLTQQCAETLIALVQHEFRVDISPTSAELAGADTVKRYLYARRLPDLAKLGLVIHLDSKRPCTVTGSAAFPWRVTEEGMRRFRALKKEAKSC